MLQVLENQKTSKMHVGELNLICIVPCTSYGFPAFRKPG